MLAPLSNRLKACCQFVHSGDRVADVGCDHGYLGIHLLQSGAATSVIASDVNPQPLQSARYNAHKYGVADKMCFILSDGVQNLPHDFDTLICAGMGADTMISILQDAQWLKGPKYRLVLQCQSRRQELRQWLNENGFSILQETLAQDGKFLYPIMEVIYAPAEPLPESGYYLSPALLQCSSPLLPAFCQRVIHGVRQTVEGLQAGGKDPERLAHYQKILSELLEMEACIHDNRC